MPKPLLLLLLLLMLMLMLLLPSGNFPIIINNKRSTEREGWPSRAARWHCYFLQKVFTSGFVVVAVSLPLTSPPPTARRRNCLIFSLCCIILGAHWKEFGEPKRLEWIFCADSRWNRFVFFPSFPPRSAYKTSCPIKIKMMGMMTQ